MSGMVERVARGIARKHRGSDDWDVIDEHDVGDRGYLLREDYRSMARAGIEVMRAPSDAMLGVKHLLGTNDRGAAIYLERGDLEDVWQAMIDAETAETGPAIA